MRCRTDGADLVVSDPDAGVRRRGRLDAEAAADGDDGLLQLADVPTDALRGRTQTHGTLDVMQRTVSSNITQGQ